MSPKPIRHKDVYLCVDSHTGLKKLLWLSFQRKGHISLGFFDSAVTVPTMESSAGDNLDLAAKHGAASVTNPHFTLHFSECPAHFHLKSESGTVLCAALVWARPFPGEEMSPWLRFVSSPIQKLAVFQRPPSGREVEIIRLASPRENCSIAINVDFAEQPDQTTVFKKTEACYFCWREIPLRVVAFCVPPQPATLGYEIMG